MIDYSKGKSGYPSHNEWCLVWIKDSSRATMIMRRSVYNKSEFWTDHVGVRWGREAEYLWLDMPSELAYMKGYSGPSEYHEIAGSIASLVQSKQEQYGDAFGKMGDILRTLYPDGIKPDQYDDLAFMVRVQDKLCRIATGNKDIESPSRDMIGYCLLREERINNTL